MSHGSGDSLRVHNYDVSCKILSRQLQRVLSNQRSRQDGHKIFKGVKVCVAVVWFVCPLEWKPLSCTS